MERPVLVWAFGSSFDLTLPVKKVTFIGLDSKAVDWVVV